MEQKELESMVLEMKDKLDNILNTVAGSVQILPGEHGKSVRTSACVQ